VDAADLADPAEVALAALVDLLLAVQTQPPADLLPVAMPGDLPLADPVVAPADPEALVDLAVAARRQSL
jgi:hypothetical protein